MRRKLVVPALVAAVVVTGFVVVAAEDRWSGSDGAQQVGFGTGQAAVRDLVRTEALNGVIAYKDVRDLYSPQTGVFTRLPAVGQDLRPGDVLMAVDEQPVVLLNGPVPAWREMKAGVADGVDVQQLEASLLALGYGKQGAGFPDAHWDAATTDAVRKLQTGLGAPTDGVLSLGEVAFAFGDVHVAKLNGHVGGMSTPGGSVMTVSSTERIVTLDLDPLDRDLVAPGAAVQVELPGGGKAPGKITTVGTSLEVNADGAQVYKVQVGLDDPAEAGDLALAPVTVRYAATIAKGVLSVPVSAIIGTPGGAYAVDVRTPDGGRARVPVKLGAWGDGYVQVTGDLAAGATVEVPK